VSVTSRICPSCNTPLPETALFCYICGAATPTGIDATTGAMTAATSSHQTSLHRLKKALGKDYEIGRLVGRGGFAEVFQVRDLRLKRDLALKALRPDLMLSDVMVARFRREAESAAQLRHPNIVPIYDVGEAENIAYILMPLVEGESLKQAIERDGPLPPPEARRILLEAASALATAHEAGVVHRDIKPENIMLEGRKRRVLLMDFGIAKAVDPNAAEQDGDLKPQAGTLTGTGMTVGTPQYMSPEQASGDFMLDHRADQYSLAVVGYQMLTGALPFDGENTRNILYKQMVEQPKPIRELAPDVPADLAQALERALMKEPKDRFPSTDAFAHALSGPTAGLQTPVTVSVTAQQPALRPIGRKRRAPALVTGLGGLVVVAGLVWGVQSGLFGGGTAETPAVDSTVVAQDTTGNPADSAVGALSAPASAPAPLTTPAGSRGAVPPATPPAANRPRTTANPAAPAAVVLTCASAARDAKWSEALDRCATEGDSGSASAARILGTLYEYGRGTPASFPDAASWYTRAAAAGDPEGKFRLAELYRAGRGVPQNLGQAQTLYREAAERGLRDAWLPLAVMYEEGGRGARKDEVEAVVWYRRAAEEGNSPRAQGKLGDMYARGRGVRKDDAEAMRWFLKGAEGGDSWAQYQAGMSYLRGRGVARADSLGWSWISKAAEQGVEDARKELARKP